MSSHVKSSSYLGTALAEYAASNVVLSMLSTTTQYRWSTSIFTAGVCVCVCVPQQSISPSTASAVGRYAGECCQNVGSWRDLRQVL